MTRKKKNQIMLLVLCVVLAGAVLLYYFLPQRMENKETGLEETESIIVDRIDSTSVSSLEVKKEGEVIYSIQKISGSWQFPDDKEVPLDSDVIAGLLDSLNPVRASREFKMMEGQDLSQYGLEAPAMTIQLDCDDGKSIQYNLGETVPISGGYYGSSASGDLIYCLDESMYSTFDIEKNSLIRMEELPELDASRIIYLKVENKKGTDFEAAVGEDGKTWEVSRPEKRKMKQEDTEWETVRGYFTSLMYDSIAEYHSTNLDRYGLKEPSAVITIKYYEEGKESGDSEGAASGAGAHGAAEEERVYHTLQLCIGDSCEEGYYVCRKDSSNVYIMAEDIVKNMTEVDGYGFK